MSNNNEVIIKVETIQEIIKEMKEISTLCSTPQLKGKIERLQKLVSSFLELREKVPAQDLIYDKMVQVKHLNPDLHLKLYMLYRNLTSGRISEADALNAFESYLSMFPSDVMIF
jgi:hypothetical protein